MTTALEAAADLVLMQYTGEPCRICGVPLTLDDVLDHAVFIGYSADSKSRAAHRACWERYLSVARQLHEDGVLISIINKG